MISTLAFWCATFFTTLRTRSNFQVAACSIGDLFRVHRESKRMHPLAAVVPWLGFLLAVDDQDKRKAVMMFSRTLLGESVRWDRPHRRSSIDNADGRRLQMVRLRSPATNRARQGREQAGARPRSADDLAFPARKMPRVRCRFLLHFPLFQYYQKGSCPSFSGFFAG